MQRACSSISVFPPIGDRVLAKQGPQHAKPLDPNQPPEFVVIYYSCPTVTQPRHCESTRRPTLSHTSRLPILAARRLLPTHPFCLPVACNSTPSLRTSQGLWRVALQFPRLPALVLVAARHRGVILACASSVKSAKASGLRVGA
jgi:hypothetical protein